ncbi:SDR family oxidoreductase [Enterococcus xiangfangensis]|uniref:SDR family oxidoreductase n=1 Tax=Enterococcus xiangfangensis TaxID=1296537 RepID=UPI0010F52258|nr:SDR family oxidoreductase [Enterococcus xiangfangensis]MBM7711006.1 NAD(P)-dependent dehydrogenase (short-subunit alcohol dehydrogenase family) [Enterococcus xiangfangensis]
MEITEFSMDLFSLRGQTAIVTGGNTGIGRALSLALAKSGANILVPSLIDDDGTTQKIIEETGSCYVFMEVDLTEENVSKQVVEYCVEVFGGVDILVNCAGMHLSDEVLQFDRSKWNPMVQLNLTAAFEMAHEAAKVMIPQKSGKIINICSLFSYLGGQQSPANAAAKHGLVGLTKAYCDELATYGIQVNGIAPGYLMTDMTIRDQENPVINQQVLTHTPAKRWGELSDLMGTLIFLASPASNFVNGHVLPVDGGYLVR